METITLAAYLEKNTDSKRLNKRVVRAIKAYKRLVKDLRSADRDVTRAGEDCAFALQTAGQVVKDCRTILDDWALPEEAEIPPELEAAGSGESCDGDCGCPCGGESCEVSEETVSLGELEKNLRRAAKDIGDALQDAEAALDGLDKVEGLLFDIIEMAEEDGYTIHIADAKACLLRKIKEQAETTGTDSGSAGA